MSVTALDQTSSRELPHRSRLGRYAMSKDWHRHATMRQNLSTAKRPNTMSATPRSMVSGFEFSNDDLQQALGVFHGAPSPRSSPERTQTCIHGLESNVSGD